jgi:hypothetical protein
MKVKRRSLDPSCQLSAVVLGTSIGSYASGGTGTTVEKTGYPNLKLKAKQGSKPRQGTFERPDSGVYLESE